VQIRQNPPAKADLDKAWLATVRLGRATLAFYVLICLSSVLMAAGVRVGYPLFFLVLLGYVIVAGRMRRKTWLSRAVAVVGTRPDIGYQRFARIPALVRMTTLNKAVLPAIPVLFIVRVVTVRQQSVPTALNIGLWILIWVIAASTSGIMYALSARARRDLDRLLAVRVPTRA
jgi:hypothetical protein